MNRHTHLSEEDLIAFHLHEGVRPETILAHLEDCRECATLSESVAQTLRVFSAEPVPKPNLEDQWIRLRGNLSVQEPPRRRPFRLLLWPVAGLATAAIALRLFIPLHLKHPALPSIGLAGTSHRVPFTTAPADPDIARQLDSAERLLTEVSHTTGPLDENTHSQARDLLLKNAVYIRSAHDHGDLGTASVLEDLGRLLTNINHESASDAAGWHLRFEMNTDGLLLDIRILRQNGTPQ